MKKVKLFILCFCLIQITTNTVSAQETGHYVPGIVGIKGGTLPPPGFYYIMHNVYYTSNAMYDGSGDKANIDFKLNVFSNAHRFVYVWEDVIWGANYAVNMIVPLVYTDISVAGFNDSRFALGDVVLEPLVLAWNEKKYDLTIGLAAVAPTGKYDTRKPALPGKSWWSGMLTVGGTYYFDTSKLWHTSVVSRYEIHGSKKDVDLTPGNDLTFEWGIGKTIPSKVIWNVGISGYAHWQVSEDSGKDIAYKSDVKDRIFSIGPEVGGYLPKAKLNVEFRGHYEFGAIDRPQGFMICLSLYKSF